MRFLCVHPDAGDPMVDLGVALAEKWGIITRIL